jgi:nitrite reductase (NADH) small subunit
MAASPIPMPPDDRTPIALSSTPHPEAKWIDVCRVDDITPDTGAAALVGGVQVAIVRVGAGTGDDAQIYAVGNYDPFSRAFVIARGIVGDRAGVPKIASPIFKQSFDLRTGQCLDDPSVRLPSYPVQVRDGRIAILIAPVNQEPPS